MAMATLTAVTSLKQTLSSKNSTKALPDLSFSSYLSNKDENFERKLADSSRNLSPKVAVEDQDVEDNHFLRRKTEEEDGEIGVFSAEKYFNGVTDVNSPIISSIIPKKLDQPKKDEQINFVSVKPKLNPATPSIRSESSWNSQTALLQKNGRRKTWQGNTNKPSEKIKKNFLAGLGCKCACSDKDSIDVEDENVGEISFRKHINGAALLQTKPFTEEVIIKPSSGSSLVNDEIHSVSGNLENPRRSLEVFGSPVQDKKSKSFRIERRLSMLSWDAQKRMEGNEYSDTPSGLFNNDSGSDASSSDLFEIQSLKANPFLARQLSGANSGCATPTTGYPPSEASIEWSVVTASAADFSVMSDYEELRPQATTAAAAAAANFLTSAKPKTTSTVRETTRRGPGILLGCSSTKAVRVAGNAHRTNDHKPNHDPRLRRISDSYMQVTRFPPENKLTGLDSTQGLRAFSTLSLPRSQPSQSSHRFYIQ